jgi:LSD1 subclass zinc finger protein
MAGLMQWFQVTCPNCTAALQVRLPEGVTTVQCSQCKAVFAVQVQPVALNTSSTQAPTKRSRKRKSSTADKSSGEVPRTLSAYNVFMKGEVAKVKGEHPELPHREAFKLVCHPTPVQERPAARAQPPFAPSLSAHNRTFALLLRHEASLIVHTRACSRAAGG